MRSLILYFIFASQAAPAAVLKQAWLMKNEIQLQIEMPESRNGYLVNLHFQGQR